MAGKHATISSAETKVNGINVQASIYGKAEGMGWGRNRVPADLLWFSDLVATPHTSNASSGGKGGGVTQSSTTYTYTAALILGVCKGPITGIRKVYRDKSVFVDGGTTALAQAGLSVALGAAGQAVWSYLTTNHPGEAIGYSGIAYCYAAGYPLNSGASVPNHSFEVDFASQVSGLPDANPSNILTDLVAAVPGWTSGLMGSLTQYSTYCLASNILLSPYLDQQSQASTFLTDLFRLTNSDCVWSEGVLKVVPYGDAVVTGNGVTFTPNLTPVYDLTNDHFLDPEQPVRIDTTRAADAWNSIQLEILDRGHAYNNSIITAEDQAAVDLYGRRKDNPINGKAICEPVIGRIVAQLILQRAFYVRQSYFFKVDDRFFLLEPMVDLVTLTDTRLGLSRELVRIVKIDEDEDGNLNIEAEQMLVGTASAASYGSQAAGGYAPNYDALPGAVATPVIFNPPMSLAGDYEVWAAVCGASPNWGGAYVWASFDGTNYEMVGTINGPARYGVTTATFASGSDPDTSHTLAVDLTTSGGALVTATQPDADHDATLCLVGSELISYRDATLTSAFHYNLAGYIRRGRFGTTIASHASSSTFVRLDDAIFKVSYSANQVGSSFRMKFQSFNVHGMAVQDLSTCTAYSITPTATVTTGSFPASPSVTPGVRTNGTESWSVLGFAWTNVTDLDARGVRIEYRIVGTVGSNTFDQDINPASATAQVATSPQVAGGYIYEARFATLYTPDREPSFSGWTSAGAATVLTTVSVAGSSFSSGSVNMAGRWNFDDGSLI